MGQPNPKLNQTRRRLPHWELNGATYFVTFRLLNGELAASERQLVLDHIRSGDQQFYRLLAVVIMPDHVHLLLKPMDGYTLARIMKGIKGASARLINKHREQSGSIWQDESYDRIVRDEEEFFEKVDYIRDNPRRAGLTENPKDYPFQYNAFK